MYLSKKIEIRKFFSKQIILTIIGVFVIGAIGVPLAKNISKQYQINTEINELENEIAVYEGKNLELKKTLNFLESDQFADEQARINLNYKKDGEEMVVIKTSDKESTDNSSQDALDSNLVYNVKGLDKIIPPKEISNPVKWWRYFFLKQ